MRRYSNNDEIAVAVDVSARRIKLKAVSVEAPAAFSDEDTAAVAGTEIYAMPSTSSREEFIELINESKDIFVTDLGHEVEVEDLSGIAAGAPLGVYANSTHDRIFEIQEEAGVYTMFPYIERHKVAADDDIIYAPGISTDTKGIKSVTGTTSTVTVNGRETLQCTTDVLIGVEKIITISEKFVRARHTRHNVHLHKNGRIVYSMQQDDEVELSVVDDNRGLLVDMPAFAWFRDGEEQLDIEESLAFAKVQGATLFQRKSVTSVTAMPVDVHSLVVVCGAGLYQVFATRVNGQRVLVYTADNIPVGAKFCIVNNQNEKRTIVRPRHTRKVDVSSREVATIISVDVPAGVAPPQLFMENSSCEIKLVAGSATLAFADTHITGNILDPGRHTIAFIRTGATTGTLSQLNHTTGVHFQHTFVEGTTFSDPRLPSDPIKIGAGIRIRAIAVCDAARAREVTEMMFEDFEGVRRTHRVLGAYTEDTRTFADGSFYRDDQTLHIFGDPDDQFHYRRHLLLSQQCANILRVPRELTQTFTRGILPMYDERFVSCNILDLTGKCIYHGDLVASNLSIDEEVAIQENEMRLFCELVDRQSGTPIPSKNILWNIAFTLH